MKCAYCNKELTSGDKHPHFCNDCDSKNAQIIPIKFGWVCPKCGNVYAPDTTECNNCNNGCKAR